LYDKDYLYFFCSFADDDIVTANSPELYNGDAVELFIMPEIRYYTYVELVFSPAGKSYTQWVNQSVRSRFELSAYHPESLYVASKIGEGGYSVEGRIGFRDLPGYLRGNPAKSGETLRLMMIRIDKDSSGRMASSTPVPFLYNGHNFFGYMTVVLQ
jgi:hypothetical protein